MLMRYIISSGRGGCFNTHPVLTNSLLEQATMAIDLFAVISDPTQRLTIERRFRQSLDVSGGGGACWPWTGARTLKGYGEIRVKGVHVRAHRLAWTLLRGRIPDGLSVLHRCDNPPCANPAHLFLGTPLDNTTDMKAKGRGHCGVRTGGAKLNDETVKAINADPRLYHAIAKEYGVSKTAVLNIKNGRYWRHVQRPLDVGRNWVFLEANGRRLRLCEWARELGASASLIRTRIANGWPVERAVTQPVRSCRRR